MREELDLLKDDVNNVGYSRERLISAVHRIYKILEHHETRAEDSGITPELIALRNKLDAARTSPGFERKDMNVVKSIIDDIIVTITLLVDYLT